MNRPHFFMVLAPELASSGPLRWTGGCNTLALLTALQGMAKVPLVGTGAAGPAPKTCQLKPCWCCNRNVSPVPSLHLTGFVLTKKGWANGQTPSPTKSTPWGGAVGATGETQISIRASHLHHLLPGVESDLPVPSKEERRKSESWDLDPKPTAPPTL